MSNADWGFAPLLWVSDVLPAIRVFPGPAKARLVGELVHLRRAGSNSAWAPLRGVPGAIQTATRMEVRKGLPQKAFRVLCTTSFFPEVIVVHAFEREERRVDEPLLEKHLSAMRARLAKIQLDRAERQVKRISLLPSSINPFVDVGFGEAEGGDLLERAVLMSDLRLLQRRSTESQLCHTVRDLLRRSIDTLCVESLKTAVQAARTATIT